MPAPLIIIDAPGPSPTTTLSPVSPAPIVTTPTPGESTGH